MNDPMPKEHLRFQRRLWKVERVAWWVEVGIVVAALAGLAGGGPLARAKAESGGLAVEYMRFARKDAPGDLTVDVHPSLARGGRVRLDLDRRWLEGVEIERIVPEPEASDAAADVTGFTFRVEGNAAARVSFHLKHRRMGPLRGTLAVPGGSAVTLSQWVYP